LDLITQWELGKEIGSVSLSKAMKGWVMGAVRETVDVNPGARSTVGDELAGVMAIQR
jgi:hypothetical protein